MKKSNVEGEVIAFSPAIQFHGFDCSRSEPVQYLKSLMGLELNPGLMMTLIFFSVPTMMLMKALICLSANRNVRV